MSCCPRHDPLLRAGLLVCETCGQVAYPNDAAWLDDDRQIVLAAFPPICQHCPRAEVWVSDVAQLRVVRLDAAKQQLRVVRSEDVEPDAARHDPGRRCAGQTRLG